MQNRVILIACVLAGSLWAPYVTAKEPLRQCSFDIAEWMKGKPLALAALSQATRGMSYYFGENNVRQDYAEAAKELRGAAERGFAIAQVFLGTMYEYGEGVPQDNAEAVKWYRKAAAQCLFRAQFSLGAMYAVGRGVPRDYVQAHMWFTLAAAQGTSDEGEFEKAQNGRDIVARGMTPAQIAEAHKMAREWLEKHAQ